MVFRRKLGFASLGLILAAHLSAQSAPAPRPKAELPSITIQGSVQGPDGTPFPGVRVDIRPRGVSDEIDADTTSDVDGRFAFFGVPLRPGQYVVHASASGYDPDEKPFTVAPGKPTAFTLNLAVKTVQAKTRGPSIGFTVVRVFYATDRRSVIDHQSLHYLGIQSPKNTVSYGSCDVSIPLRHTLAKLERPSIWRLEYHADPEKHIVLQKIESETEDAFFTQVSGSISASQGKEAFVFVHGYNESFEDAAIRTAQLTYDFGFNGAPILYSWPSKGSLLGYLADEKAVEATAANLRQFLQDVADRSGATVVHLIAHSMGNRALLSAVSQLAADPQFKNYDEFKSLVLAAPDVDRDAFEAYVKRIQKPDSNITLYVSRNDQALVASHLLFHKQPRAGEGGKDSIVMPGLDTVDVSGLSADALGHSYYGDNRNVVEDVLAFLKGHLAPRPGLFKVPTGSLAYWQLLATTSANESATTPN
jgi:esterase/lipase superfamily enzyme